MTLRRRLQVSFAAVALSAIGIGLSSWLHWRRLEGDARAINLAGSQRMRAWRLATLASQHASWRDLVTAEAIEAEIGRFRETLAALEGGDDARGRGGTGPGRAQETLAALEGGDDARGLKPAPSAEARAALAAGRDLFGIYERSIRSTVAKADSGAPDLWLEVQATVALAAAVAERMDAATAEFERASAAALARFREVQLALFALTAAVALLAFGAMRRGVLGRLPAIEEGLHELARGRLGAEVHPLGAAAEELRRLEEAFNEMSRELERVDRLKSLFVATVSHELRTPLTSIIGFADLLRRGTYGALEPRQLEAVEVVLRSGRRLLDLVGDILDLAKIEAGKAEVRPERFELGPVVSEAAEALRPLAEAKGLALEVAAPEEPVLVESDPARVRQVLLNLLSNAVKFTDRGHVRLRTFPRPAAGSVAVEVEDTGIGIAPADVPRLFGRFEQIDASPTRRHGGTGLGLHISRRLADLLGARIEVASEPGRGSRFALVLPERFARPAGRPGREEAPWPDRPRRAPDGSSSSTTTRTS